MLVKNAFALIGVVVVGAALYTAGYFGGFTTGIMGGYAVADKLTFGDNEKVTEVKPDEKEAQE